jgi:hypothetical protein
MYEGSTKDLRTICEGCRNDPPEIHLLKACSDSSEGMLQGVHFVAFLWEVTNHLVTAKRIGRVHPARQVGAACDWPALML